jgi:hypothetical protein
VSKSFVLQALKIFGLEEMLKLSQTGQVKAAMLKKAAGAELIVWDDAPETESRAPEERPEAKVLPFKKQFAEPSQISEPIPDPHLAQGKPSEESGNFYSSEFMLWQRELSKDTTTPLKKDAVQGYARATEMYVVKTPTIDGKEKIRFAGTNGILVDKKQA